MEGIRKIQINLGDLFGFSRDGFCPGTAGQYTANLIFCIFYMQLSSTNQIHSNSSNSFKFLHNLLILQDIPDHNLLFEQVMLHHYFPVSKPMSKI